MGNRRDEYPIFMMVDGNAEVSAVAEMLPTQANDVVVVLPCEPGKGLGSRM